MAATRKVGLEAGAILLCKPLQLGQKHLFKRPWQQIASAVVRTVHVSPMYAELCGSMLALILLMSFVKHAGIPELANIDQFSLVYFCDTLSR